MYMQSFSTLDKESVLLLKLHFSWMFKDVKTPNLMRAEMTA